MTTAATHDPLFNPLDPGVIEDPYVAYRTLRERAPVYWHEQLRSWVLTRYEHCDAVLRDSDRFTTDWRKIGVATPPTLLSLQTIDPPDQTPLRHLGLEAMRAQDLAVLEEDARARARAMLAEREGASSFDFASDFAEVFTLGTITRLLGVDPPGAAEEERWHRLNDDLDHSMDAGLDPEAEPPGIEARAWFNDIVEGWLADPPEGGLLAYLVANIDRAGVSQEILVNSLRAFFHAGFEVPARFLGNAVHAVLSSPPAWEAIIDGAPLDLAVDELVRFVGPVHALSRACTRSTELGGERIEHGDIVIAMIAAANRDPSRFDDPENLVLDRKPNPHLGFGRGTHSCMGIHVGRLQARALLGELARGYPGTHLAGEVVRRPNATLRGMAELPVTLGR